jgi:betaine lipid synthase
LTLSGSPYYMWLGRSRRCDVSEFCHAFEVEGGNTIANTSPRWQPFASDSVSGLSSMPNLEIGASAGDVSRNTTHSNASIVDIKLPLSSFYYGLQKVKFLVFVS